MIGLVYNGNLINVCFFRKELEENGVIFYFNFDMEILMYLIWWSEEIDFLNKLKSVLNEVKGGFVYLLMMEMVMIVVLDLNGFCLLVIG